MLFPGNFWVPGEEIRILAFFEVFEKFEKKFPKICARSERYRNLLAGIFKIPTFYGNIAFPMSPV